MKTEKSPGGPVERIVGRPADATHNALRKCLQWLDECRRIGWGEETMLELESVFWKFHDSNGDKKPPNAKLSGSR